MSASTSTTDGRERIDVDDLVGLAQIDTDPADLSDHDLLETTFATNRLLGLIEGLSRGAESEALVTDEEKVERVRAHADVLVDEVFGRIRQGSDEEPPHGDSARGDVA